ncbi:UDP-glucose/GDP-mannose dehydrogenase family protein [Geomicrobium sp. JSM 1781026]|uniref:UDP-glucose dehydrogenase family protein n=1 Tax=Geomicrobium sp. JSM 1781026 TaxID=3344580 RepID=UPI0035C0A37A
MKLTIIGTGYVGLVSGVCFAELGNTVVCVDKVSSKVKELQKGVSPIYEPGLEELLQKNINKGNISFTTDLRQEVLDSDVILIAVGTPQAADGSADLSYVRQVAKEIGESIPSSSRYVIVNKSTVPVGTTQTVRNIILDERPDANIAVCSVPEFLREGSAIYDTMNPDRIVIGSSSDWATELLIKLHSPLASGEKVVLTDEPSAEMIKYAANSFLATKISFINEIANISDYLGANIDDVVRGIGSDRRISPHFLNAGLGYGGSCFPKDVRALMNMANNKEYDPAMLQVVDEVNNRQRQRPIEQLDVHFKSSLNGKTIAILGLAFKPNTNDMRDAPSIDIIHELNKRGAIVRAHDPIAIHAAEPLLPRSVALLNTAEDALKEADAIILVTEWNEYKQLDPKEISKHMHQLVMVDGRNALDDVAYKQAGFDYYGIGRS